MCTVLLPPGDNPIAGNKYIIIRNKKGFVEIKMREIKFFRNKNGLGLYLC
jgi:hypothetical protein